MTGVNTKEGEGSFMFVCGKIRCVGMKFRGPIFKPNVRQKCLTTFWQKMSAREGCYDSERQFVHF